MKSKKSWLYLLLPILALNIGLWAYFIYRQPEEPASKSDKLACDVKGFRRQGFRFTKPLLMLDRSCDDPSLEPLRQKLLSYANDARAKGMADKISIYFRMLDNGINLSVNEDSYSPGSLMKIMTLITYLKDAETDKGLLSKEVLFNTRFSGMPAPVILGSRGAEFGKSYTVDELLDFMITESDNNATALLNSSIDMKVYNDVLSALNLPIPDPRQSDYPLTTETMSRFFRLLYNSSFLSPQMSDKALELLTRSSYRQGLLRYIGDKATVAHKFGEKNTDGYFQLHEGGIFFVGTADYVLIVMTKGKDQSGLADVLADVSRIVFEDVIVNYGTTASEAGMLTLDKRVPGTLRVKQ
ncbi:MAG: hypothetical protein RL213_1267 [Bacteroidota bacterium]|jgi:beta-lactamase class A